MTTATKHLKTVAQAPTARGTFSGLIDYNPPLGDYDRERIESFTNLPGRFPLGYQHTAGDPGAIVGDAHARSKGDGRHLLVSAKLDLASVMGRAIHERLLLPSGDPQALKELSVGFSFDVRKAWTDTNGIRVLPDCELVEISVVHRGAQDTRIFDAKSATKVGARNSVADLARIQRVHDNAVELGAVCDPAPTPKRSGSRCACGSPMVGAFRTMRAIKDGVDLGPLHYRPCRRCGMLELQGNAAIQRAGSGDHWAKFIKRGRTVDPEVARVKAFFDDVASGVRRVDRNAVDRWLAEDAAARRKEREADAQLEAIAVRQTLTDLLPSEADRDRREEERKARDLAEIARRDQERAREAEQHERADAARRGPDVQVIRG